MSGAYRIEIGDQALIETSALLRSLLQQIYKQVGGPLKSTHGTPQKTRDQS